MLKFDVFKFDSRSGQLIKEDSDTPIILRYKLIQLLNYLLLNQDRVISKDELLNALWENGQYREQSLSQSILELRKALGDSASSPKYIRTIPNQGYEWVGPQINRLQEKQIHSKKFTQLEFIKRPVLIVPLVVALVLSIVFTYYFFSLAVSDPTYKTHTNLKVLVLPFENKTHTSSMDWVEYGLSDMMANDLMSIQGLDIISPTQLSVLLTANDRSQYSDIQPLAIFLKENDIDIAIKSSVKLAKNQQVLSYQIITPEGEYESGVFERKDLAVSMPDIAGQLYTLLKPKSEKVKLPLYDYVPSAMHDYARGIQALQSEGAVLAQHYFSASMQIDSNHAWSTAYQGVCQLHLGNWLDSERLFEQALVLDTDNALHSFVYYWLSLINYRRGLLDTSSAQLARSLDNLGAESGSLLASMINQLHARILLLRPELSGVLASKSQTLFPASSAESTSIFESITIDVPIFLADTISNRQSLEDKARRLTEKGHKPALFLILLTLARQSDITLAERENLFERAIEIAEQLNQPYELALTLALRTHYEIDHENSGAKKHLTQAYAIANKLGAKQLLEDIRLHALTHGNTQDNDL